jgi:hypothetical protein
MKLAKAANQKRVARDLRTGADCDAIMRTEPVRSKRRSSRLIAASRSRRTPFVIL